MLRGIDLPDLLEANCIVLRIDAGAQIETRFEPPSEMAPTTFREYGESTLELVAALVVRFHRAVARDAHVAGHDADNAAAVVQHVRSGEARQHVTAERFRLLAEPTAQIAEADDVVTGVT